MNSWQDFFRWEVAGNELWRVTGFFGLLLVFLLAAKVLRQQLIRVSEIRRKQGQVVWPALLGAVGRSLALLSWAVGLIQALRFLVIPERLAGPIRAATGVFVTAAVGYLAYCLVDVVEAAMKRRAERTENRLDDLLVLMTRKSLRATIVALAILQSIQMLSDKPLASILAGLGVGSLAVALAGQDTIKNFFGSIVILADKPFELGQIVTVEGHTGVVESVGMRSTRLRTFEGQLIAYPNGELSNRAIVNISRRPFIRRTLNIGIPYDTPPAKVRRALEIVRELLANHEGMNPDRPPRVFFNEFNAASLNLLIIYWYHPPDFFAALAFAEKFNLALLERFAAEGIDFAFPTQTLFLAGDPKRALSLSLPGAERGASLENA